MEPNTDRNTRIFLAVAVAYFAYFGPSFRIPVFGGFVSSVLDSAGHAAAACHAHVPPPRSPAAAGATPRPLCCVQLLPPVPPNRADRQSGTHRKSARDRARELWQLREWRRSGRINCHLYLKKAPSPLRFEAAASRKSRRPVQPLKSPLPAKRRQPFLLPLLLELLLRSTMLIIMMM
jgi:hypothetical protein